MPKSLGRRKLEWIMRAATVTALASVSLVLAALSVVRLFGIPVADWPELIQTVVAPNISVIVGLIESIAALLRQLPAWLVDGVTLFLLLGTLMKLSVRTIELLQAHWLYLDPNLNQTENEREDTERQEAASKYRLYLEERWLTLGWPVRLYSDIRARYWTLTPLRLLIVSVLICLLIVLMKLIF